ncbi:MAG: hypothetical protein AAB288_06520, partial [Acidobacteriota bacterium]
RASPYMRTYWALMGLKFMSGLVSGNRTGGRKVDAADVGGPNGIGRAARLPSLQPYFTMDATASYRLRKNIDIFAAAENVFNSRYDIGLTPNRTVAAPAFVRVGLRVDLSRK